MANSPFPTNSYVFISLIVGGVHYKICAGEYSAVMLRTIKYDSDQSLSEEEDLNGAGMEVLSELGKLQRSNSKIDHGANFNAIRRASRVEGNIEFPTYSNMEATRWRQTSSSMLFMDLGSRTLGLASVPNSDEEIVSDDEKATFDRTGSVSLCEEKDSWFGITERVDALVQLNQRNQTGQVDAAGPAKPKPNLLHSLLSKKEDLPLLVCDRSETGMLHTDLLLTEELEGGSDIDHQRSIANSLEIYNGREVGLHENGVVRRESDKSHNCDGTSVAGLLANLQENSAHVEESCKWPKRLKRRKHSCFRRSNSPDENIDDEDILMVGTSVADAEGDILDSKPMKTMAESFHDALGAISPSGELLSEVTMHTLGVGLYDKLQRVMLSEKKKDVDFLEKPILDDHSRDGKGCIDVRVLSRSLEAKHKVCCCAVIPHKEISQLVNESNIARQCGERNLTVIFSSRICGDVDLEVGNVIRIQPPWKELREQDDILLATYFFPIGD